MGWVVTASLARLMSDFREAFPGKDRASDGTIGDAAHQAETSGHNPDDTPGSRAEYSDADAKAEVRAIDVDNDLHDPRGVTMQQVIDRMLQTPADLRRLRYIIYNRRIWSRNTSWQSRAYTGSSPHTEHAHFSGDPDCDEDASPWMSVLAFKQEDDVNQSDKVTGWQSKGNSVGDVLADVSNERDWWYAPPGTVTKNPPPAGSRADIVLQAAQRVLAAEPPAVVLTDEQAAAMADKVAAALAARPDVPLGDADKPAIVAAVKQALAEGVA